MHPFYNVVAMSRIGAMIVACHIQAHMLYEYIDVAENMENASMTLASQEPSCSSAECIVGLRMTHTSMIMGDANNASLWTQW
jgi:hypothetical protein